MSTWPAKLAVLAVALACSTAAGGAERAPSALRPGLWKGEAVNRVDGEGAAAAVAMAIAGRIPLTKCIPPDLATQGPLAVLRDGSDCQLKASGKRGEQITADQVCRERSGKNELSKVVIQSSREKMVVTITGQAPTSEGSLPMTITDTLVWANPSCG